MKSTGMVRKLDKLGRIVLPKRLREMLEINENDSLEVFVEKDRVIYQKYKPNMECVITGKVSDENKIYAGNIILSPEGAKALKKEIQSQKEQNNLKNNEY